MMAIPDKNETIYQVVYTSIKGPINLKALKELVSSIISLCQIKTIVINFINNFFLF